MGDKVTRQLLKTTDGKPSTGKIVKLRPAETAGVGSDISLPETPALSGIYRSAADVPHGVWKEVIDGVETGETLAVEPGRACYALYTDKTKTALVDRLLTDVVRLSGFVADADSEATPANLYDAIIHAMTYKKTLVMTDDVTLSSAVSMAAYDLYVDLNGKMLTFAAGITCTKAFFKNGKVALQAGSQSIVASVGTCWENIEFTQNGSSQVTANFDDRYINVRGMPTTIPGTTATKPIVIGCAGVASVDKLNVNSSTLGYLQTFLDSMFLNLQSINNWLTSAKRQVLDQFALAPLAMRTAFQNGSIAGDEVAANSVRSASYQTTGLADVHRLGVDHNGFFVDKGIVEAESTFVVSSVGNAYGDVVVDVNSLGKKNLMFNNNGAMATKYASITGAPSTGSPDVIYATCNGAQSVDLYVSPTRVVTIAPGKVAILVWNYSTSTWFVNGG